MIKPKTRKEVFMDAIAKGKKPPIEPLTREEVLMAEHAEREASGGGGSAALVFTENKQGEVTANMSFEDAYNSVASGASTVLFSQDGDVTKIWYPKEGIIFSNWFSIAYTDGDKNVEIAYNPDTGKFNKVE